MSRFIKNYRLINQIGHILTYKIGWQEKWEFSFIIYSSKTIHKVSSGSVLCKIGVLLVGKYSSSKKLDCK